MGAAFVLVSLSCMYMADDLLLACIVPGGGQRDEAGMRSFCKRVITKAEDKLKDAMLSSTVPAISAAPTPGTDAGALGLLVGAITKSQHNVHVDLKSKISVCWYASLCSASVALLCSLGDHVGAFAHLCLSHKPCGRQACHLAQQSNRAGQSCEAIRVC